LGQLDTVGPTQTGFGLNPDTVRAELVEALSFSSSAKAEQDFDRLSPNGRGYSVYPGWGRAISVVPMRLLRSVFTITAAALLTAGAAPANQSPSTNPEGPHFSRAAAAAPIAPPPATLRIDPFYAKYIDAGGIPVLGSANAPDAALRVARATMLEMLAKRPDIRARLVRQGVHVAVLAPDDAITDLPEHRDWKKPARDDPRLTTCELKNYALIEAATDRDYWNARSRGSGGLLTAAGAENLLALPGDRYAGENILVHEFAHAILTAIEEADPKLYARVQRAYAHAVAAGKWKGDYAAVTVQEYWAEGTQFWFDDNRLARLDDGPIVSDGDLKRYDPELWAALAKVYRGHRIAADPWYLHPSRLNVPLGYKSADC